MLLSFLGREFKKTSDGAREIRIRVSSDQSWGEFQYVRGNSMNIDGSVACSEMDGRYLEVMIELHACANRPYQICLDRLAESF